MVQRVIIRNDLFYTGRTGVVLNDDPDFGWDYMIRLDDIPGDKGCIIGVKNYQVTVLETWDVLDKQTGRFLSRVDDPYVYPPHSDGSFCFYNQVTGEVVY